MKRAIAPQLGTSQTRKLQLNQIFYQALAPSAKIGGTLYT